MDSQKNKKCKRRRYGGISKRWLNENLSFKVTADKQVTNTLASARGNSASWNFQIGNSTYVAKSDHHSKHLTDMSCIVHIPKLRAAVDLHARRSSLKGLNPDRVVIFNLPIILIWIVKTAEAWPVLTTLEILAVSVCLTQCTMNQSILPCLILFA